MRIFRSRIAAYFSFACGLSAFAVFAPFIAAQAPTAPPLEVAYFRAFRAYEASTHIAAPSGKIRASEQTEQDSIPALLNLSGNELAVFVDAAISFAKEQRWVQQAKEAIVEQDRASHPGMRSISPQARARVHELFDELELNVIDGVVSIHRAFGPGAAARLDNAVMNGFGSIATAASPSALHFPPPSKVSEEPILSGQRRLGALTSINPKFTDPVEDYCTNLTPDEEQYDEDECYNEGAVYDLENCECSIPLVNGGGGGGGGGGSSTGDPSPFIRSITPDTWMAGETQSVTIGGLYFGTNEPTLGFTPGSGISYVVSSYSDFQIVASIKVSNSTPSEIVGLTVTNNGYGGSAFFGGSGGASPQSNQSSATIQAAPPPSSYTIAYNAYIPADHITGPGKCTYNSNQYNFIYKGDGGYNSYRVTETADLNTTTWAGTNFFPMTGQTRQ
jgi:hypothetical protein